MHVLHAAIIELDSDARLQYARHSAGYSRMPGDADIHNPLATPKLIAVAVDLPNDHAAIPGSSVGTFRPKSISITGRGRAATL